MVAYCGQSSGAWVSRQLAVSRQHAIQWVTTIPCLPDGSKAWVTRNLDVGLCARAQAL